MPTTAFIRPPAAPATLAAFASAGVPTRALDDACRACEGEVGDDVPEYPKGFDMDLTTEMLNFSPYCRQILISTGKADWAHDVCEDATSLQGLVKSADAAASSSDAGGVFGKLTKKLKNVKLGGSAGGGGEEGALAPGIYPSSAVVGTTSTTPKLTILSASHYSSSCEDDEHGVIVLPDFKIVQGVKETKEAAAELQERYLDASVGRAGSLEGAGTLKSWPLPYRAVILLCSHKKRDKRCHIAAELLLEQLHHQLGNRGIEIDERGDDLEEGSSIEEWDAERRERKLEESLRGVQKDGGKVGVFKVSHIGGHKFAGNVIIYFPSGTSIWYGRVTPRDVAAIVETTLIEGKVIPELLRGGLGLAGKTGPEGVLAW